MEIALQDNDKEHTDCNNEEWKSLVHTERLGNSVTSFHVLTNRRYLTYVTIKDLGIRHHPESIDQ